MDLPIVTLDKIYMKPDEKNIFFLDCTRIEGSSNLTTRKGTSIEDEIKRISKMIPSREIILADDVVFSGNVLRTIIRLFNEYGIEVLGIISSICTETSYNYFNKNLKMGILSNYKMTDDVIDQICERDFYFGIAGSGILTPSLKKAPYFKPFGNPCERASIPKNMENSFSRNCIERSLLLWEEMERKKGTSILMRELPEQIQNTEENNQVTKILRKELKRL